MNTIKNIILKKILNESVDASEEILFREWIGENSSNEELFEKIRSQELSNLIMELDEAAFGREMADEFREKIEVIRRRKRHHLIARIAYSVSAAAILTVSFLLYNQMGDAISVSEINLTENRNLSQKVGTDDNIQLITSSGVVNLDSEKDRERAASLIVNKDSNVISFVDLEQPNPVQSEVVEINTLVVPLKREFNVILPDGTKVWINSGSQFSFPVHFSDTLRSVELVGEAYFEVVKNSKAPFIVKTQRLNTKVLGTEFMVSCYDEKYEVSLIEGSVRVNEIRSDQNIVLKPGRGVVLDAADGKMNEVSVNTDKILSRKKGLIMFDEDKLSDIVVELKRWYGVDFIFEIEELKNQTFYIKINRYDDIHDIMELLKYTKKINYSIKDHTITIKKY